MEVSASVYMHDCKEDDIVIKLRHTMSEDGDVTLSRWLSISSKYGDVALNLFFNSQEDQEAVLGKLHTELDILLKPRL